MSRFTTLRGRITVVATVVAAVAIGLLTLAFNAVLSRTLDSDADDLLRTRTAAAATTLAFEHGALRARESPDDAAVDSQIWIYDRSRAIERPTAGREFQRAADALAGRTRESVDIAGLRLYAAPIERGGRPRGTIVAGVSLAPYDRTTDVALVGSLALGAILLATVCAMTWLTVGRALRPVTRMTHQAADWSAHDLARRFGPAPRPDELGELARTFDALLDRLAASMRHEQRLSAELSHELRTPLARIVAEIEMLGRRPRSTTERQEAHDVVRRSAEQMSGILETLMTAARAEAQLDSGRTNVNEALARIAEDLAPELAERGIGVRMPAERVSVSAGVDTEVVRRIVIPLLENAARHAAGSVTLESSREEGRTVITVRDDGSGVEPDQAGSVFEPGVRGNGADGHTGAGLGLPLARRLARAAGGDVHLTPPVSGRGADFRVVLPG